MLITEPGLYDNIAAADYHADPAPSPSLSNSIAQILLDQSPHHAWTAHPRLNNRHPGEDSSKRLDLGSVAHALLLGKGRGIAIIDADSYRTKDAQKQRDEARAAGKTPILAADYDRASAMMMIARDEIAACKEIGRAFFSPAARFEPVILWREGECWARAMLDFTDAALVLDYKSVTNASPDYVTRHLYQQGYHIQRGWYLRALDAIDPGGRGRRRFVFLFQEIEPPHACTFMELDGAGAAMGERSCEQAVALWQECMSTDRWPSYPRGIHRAEMPGWMESSILAREVAADERRERISSQHQIASDHLMAG